MSRDVHATRQVNVGEAVARRTLISVSGEPISMPDSHRLVHLQFRRFAGCPVCNLHLQSTWLVTAMRPVVQESEHFSHRRSCHVTTSLRNEP
jgi:hypothetical protein